MKEKFIEDDDIKLFIRFLRQYDLYYNTKIITYNYEILKHTKSVNWWVIYYDKLWFRGIIKEKNINFKRIFDLLWILFLITYVKNEKEKQYLNKILVFYFDDYKKTLQFPINDLKMLTELKLRSDVQKYM